MRRFARTTCTWSRVATVAAAAALLTGCSSLHSLAGDPSPPPALSADHSSYRLIQEPESGYSVVLDVIRQARRTLRITMYELADPAAVGAVIDAQSRGVTTKIILDAAFHGRQTNSAAYDQLKAAGVDVRWAPAATIFHQKTLTADATETAIGTANLVAKYYPSSRDAWVLDSDPIDIAAITATFDADYSAATTGRPAPGAASPHLIWSPDARADFLQQLGNAGHSIELTTEELKFLGGFYVVATVSRWLRDAATEARKSGTALRSSLPDCLVPQLLTRHPIQTGEFVPIQQLPLRLGSIDQLAVCLCS